MPDVGARQIGLNVRAEEAEAAYRRIDLRAIDVDDPMSPPMLACVVELAEEFADVDGARVIADVMAVIKRAADVVGNGVVTCAGSVARLRDRMELVASGPDAAIPLFEEGLSA